MKKTCLAIILAAVVLFLGSCWLFNDDYDEIEPNDAFSTATVLTSPGSYVARILPGEDKDYFSVQSASNVTITVDGSSTLELYVRVYNENQVQIGPPDTDTGSYGGSLTYTASISDFDGTFYIMVESTYTDDLGDYTITLE